MHRRQPQRKCGRCGTVPGFRVVRDDTSPLWRIAWPDTGPSAPANLSRCMDAAQTWAEQQFVSDHRKNGAARCLKALNNFSWSRSLVRQNERGAVNA
jgi:hypothetical protein